MTVSVLGVCGGSGAGKTTLTGHLVDALDTEQTATIAFDAYYRDLAHLSFEQRCRTNFDHPDSLDHELFVTHLDELRSGNDVDVPEYDFSTHTLTGRFNTVEARPNVIVEGILLLAFGEIARRLDYAVFLDIPEDVRLERRLRRDTVERGRHPSDVRRQFAATVAPMHDAFVEPFKSEADRVVSVGEPYGMVAREVAASIRRRSFDTTVSRTA